MALIKVGELLRLGITRYPEGSVFEYLEDGPVLFIYAGHPTQKEIEAVRKGNLEFALYETEYVLWVLYKIQGFGPWSDAPFSIRIYDGSGMVFDWSEEIVVGTGLGLQIILTDAATGIVKAMRYVSLPTNFSRFLREAILRQWEKNFSREKYDREIDRVFANFTSDELVLRTDIRCKIKRN